MAKIADNNAVKLYNLTTDIGEHHNLASSKKAKSNKLLKELAHLDEKHPYHFTNEDY